MLLVTRTGLTRSLYTDDEQSTDDALSIEWGLYNLSDGFESAPWDGLWDENGTTTWTQDTSNPHSGNSTAFSNKNTPGYLTTDEIDASEADNITVSFWFYTKNADAGDILVQTYNGTAYNTWYDLTNHPNYSNSTWSLFNEVLTDSQYFIAGFRLRFDNSAMTAGGEEVYIDDVYITTDSIPPVAPTGLVAAAGDTEVDLDWNDNGESDLWGYNVYRSTTSGGPYSQINGSLVSSSNYTNTGLTNDTTYYYVVTAVDMGSNESGYSNEDNATPTDLPAPSGLIATPGEFLADLDWNDNTDLDLDGYNVYRSTASGGPYSKINVSLVATSNYTDTGLTAGTPYYYVVTAVDLTSNESGYSNEASATPVDLPPAAPANLLATPGDREADLDWDDNGESDLDGYNVYRSTSSGGPYSKINGSLVATSNHTDTGLTGGTTYYYVVTAVDLGTNESSYSNEGNATPVDNAPSAPNGLVATPADRQVDLDWNDNTEDDLDGYNVYRSTTSGGPYSQINGSLIATSNFTDTGLTGGTTYYYVVTAVDDGSNESGYSSEDSATPTDASPSAPTGLIATPGDAKIDLDWNDNGESDLDGYNVYRSETSGGPYSQVNGSLVATSNYTDTSLTNGTTYYYVVTAVDLGSNESGYSNEASATPVDSPPAAPTGLVTTPGEFLVDLDWDDNGESDLNGYNVYRSTTSGGPYSQINGSLVATSNYTDTGLAAGTTYYYLVTAVDLVANESSYSNEANATPVDPPPAAPAGLAATPSGTQVDLDWNDNGESDLDGYNVYRSETSGGPYSQVNGSMVATSNYTDTGLTAGITYYYVVTAVDLGTNESSYSSEATADLDPAAPTGLLAAPGDKQVDLDWNDNSESDLDGYNVYRSTTSGGPYSKINVSLIATSNFTDTGLTGGTTYYYVVTAIDLAANESGYSSEANATPTDPPPAAPTNLLATPGDRHGYNVYRSATSGGPYSQINGSLVATSNYTDTGLTGGTTYYYVVTAVDLASYESGYSNEANATPTDATPAAPAGLIATKGVGQVSLNWNDNTEDDLDGYNVYRSTTSGGPYSQINGSLVATSNYTDTGVTNGATYYYVVTAVDLGSNESGYSNEDSARPVGPPQTLLDDGFELTPWDTYWDGNGTTSWYQDSTAPHQDTNNTKSDSKNNGFLTSDDLNTYPAENITASFWFKLSNADIGDCVIETYNGTTWTTWFDLVNYPTHVDNTWSQFSEVITDSQYFVTNFRIRFDSSPLVGQEEANIDDVLVVINQ
jgi:fibronectin type 3 domain-containing protein